MRSLLVQRLGLSCLMIILVFTLGCATTSDKYAKMRPDDRVKQTFESFIVAPGYQYYYYGPIEFPTAFVGISTDFTIDSSFWKPIDLTSETLHSWIWGHANRKPGNLQRYGSSIIGPNGEHIGVWYSLTSWQQWARIELAENRMVKISGPINNKRGTVDLLSF